MKVKFKPHIRKIYIDDTAKFQRYFYFFFAIIQLFTSIVQLNKYWLNYDNFIFYFFIFHFVIFSIALVYYLFYNSAQEVIKHDDIQYYKEKRILGLKVRYLKLKNGKTRLLDFKKNSKEIQALKQYFKDYELNIIS